MNPVELVERELAERQSAPAGQMWVPREPHDYLLEGDRTRVSKITPDGFRHFDTTVRRLIPGWALVDVPENT